MLHKHLQHQVPAVDVHTLIDQTRKAVEFRLYYLALMSALAIPDIAGAMESADGLAKRCRYAAWYEKWVRERLMETRGRANPFSGQEYYGFSCDVAPRTKPEGK